MSSEATCYTTVAPVPTCDTIVAGKRKKRDAVGDGGDAIGDVIDSAPKIGPQSDEESGKIRDLFRNSIRPSSTSGNINPEIIPGPDFKPESQNVTQHFLDNIEVSEVTNEREFQVPAYRHKLECLSLSLLYSQVRSLPEMTPPNLMVGFQTLPEKSRKG